MSYSLFNKCCWENWTKTDSEIQKTDWQLSERRRIGDWVKKIRNKQTQTRVWWLLEGKRVGRKGKRAKGWQKVTGRDLTLGNESTMQGADDVVLSCTLETCMVLLTNVTPINPIKILGASSNGPIGRKQESQYEWYVNIYIFKRKRFAAINEWSGRGKTRGGRGSVEATELILGKGHVSGN